MDDFLTTKDLITVGIFSALYFIILLLCGLPGFIPIFFIFLPLYAPIVTGIVFMLFLSKVQKFGMVLIMSLILGLLMFATGHTWLPIVTSLIFGLLSELVLMSGKYRSFPHSVAGYTVFSLWLTGAALPLWIDNARCLYGIYTLKHG